MATDAKKSQAARIMMLVVLLAAVGGVFLFMQLKPRSSSEIRAWINGPDSVGIALADVTAYLGVQPERLANEATDSASTENWLYTLNPQDPTRLMRIRVRISAGMTNQLREVDADGNVISPAL